MNKLLKPDTSIQFCRFKKLGEWYRFIGYHSGRDVVKKESTGEYYSLTPSQIRKIEVEEYDEEVILVNKIHNRKYYKTIQIIKK